MQHFQSFHALVTKSPERPFIPLCSVYKSAARSVGHGLFTTNPQKQPLPWPTSCQPNFHRITSSGRGVSTYEIETAGTLFLQADSSQDQQQILDKLIQQAGHIQGQTTNNMLNDIVINSDWRIS